jgi:uncharacterized membrane protein
VSELARQRQQLTAWILRVSISLCLALIGLGLLLFFLRGDKLPATPSGSLLAILANAWQRGIGLHASGFLDTGIVVLLLTPVVRLVAGVYVSARARDWLYAAIGLVVLGLVVTGLIAGQSGI